MNPKGVPENLKPFKKGEDPRRNMAGAPKKLPELNELLAKVLGEEKDGVTAAEAILSALRAKAARGDVRAAEVLLDRGYGKIKQEIDQKTEHSGSIAITWQDPELPDPENKGSA